jgi:hypothetical protein
LAPPPVQKFAYVRLRKREADILHQYLCSRGLEEGEVAGKGRKGGEWVSGMSRRGFGEGLVLDDVCLLLVVS